MIFNAAYQIVHIDAVLCLTLLGDSFICFQTCLSINYGESGQNFHVYHLIPCMEAEAVLVFA